MKKLAVAFLSLLTALVTLAGGLVRLAIAGVELGVRVLTWAAAWVASKTAAPARGAGAPAALPATEGPSASAGRRTVLEAPAPAAFLRGQTVVAAPAAPAVDEMKVGQLTAGLEGLGFKKAAVRAWITSGKVDLRLPLEQLFPMACEVLASKALVS